MNTTTPSRPSGKSPFRACRESQPRRVRRARVSLRAAHAHYAPAATLSVRRRDARARKLREVFDQARAAMKKYPGCEKFAAAATHMLNIDLRPVTAKWHRALAEGRLNSRDGGDEFRRDLAKVQQKLRVFAGDLHEMAYGTKAEDPLTEPALPPDELEACLRDVPFGVVRTSLIPDEAVDAINESERQAVHERRTARNVQAAERQNAVGLACPAAAIRSATFGLGVVQVLAERGLLKEIDFLSTVSGGGYTGSFLSTRLGNCQPQTDLAGGPTVRTRFPSATYGNTPSFWPRSI